MIPWQERKAALYEAEREPGCCARCTSKMALRGVSSASADKEPTMIRLPAFMTAAILSFAAASGAVAEPLQGSWSGNGFFKPTDGKRESVRCRVSYSPQGTSVVAVSATCASASATIRQSGQLSMVSPNKYVGDFHNSDFDISGRIRVSVSGKSQTVSFTSSKASGSMSLSKR